MRLPSRPRVRHGVAAWIGAALLLSAFVAVLFRSGGGDGASDAPASATAAADPVAVTPLPAPSGERVALVMTPT